VEGGPRVVQTILQDEIKPVLIGRDPAFPKKIRSDLWRALEYLRFTRRHPVRYLGG